MLGKLDPEERIMEPPTINEQVASIVEKLNWEEEDIPANVQTFEQYNRNFERREDMLQKYYNRTNDRSEGM